MSLDGRFLTGIAVAIVVSLAVAWTIHKRPAAGATPPPRFTGPLAARTPETEAVFAAVAGAGLDATRVRAFHDPSTKVLEFDVDAKRAVEWRDRLEPGLVSHGWYPVVVRDEHGLLEDNATRDAAGARKPADVVAAAARIDVERWLGDRQADEETYGALELGEWGREAPAKGFTIPFDVLTKKPAPDVRIAFVPTPRGWEVPAWFRLGGWNECPPAEVHVAVLHRWFDRYGARLVCLAGDTIEMRVERSPTDRAGAEALAREQFVYTGGDLVFQGTGTLRALAGTLIRAETWFFWWD